MNYKVSDFKLAESIIKKVCRNQDVQFVDSFLSFDATKTDNCIYIKDSKNISQTIFNIVGEYIDKSVNIVGKQLFPDMSFRNNFLIVLATNLRSFIYKDEEEDNSLSFSMRLYQIPMIWILFKDIICPIYDKKLTNIKLIVSNSNKMDISKYFSKIELESSGIEEEDFIFVNNINNRIVKNAFIFVEVLKYYDLSPTQVLKDIYETELYDKFHGMLEIALDDDEIIDFECTVMAILGINIYGLMCKKLSFDKKNVKTAQSKVNYMAGSFWFLGVLEKMLEKERGSDWTVYNNLQPYVQEFWDKVEEVKKARVKDGKDVGVPFDELLRLKSKQTVDYKADTSKTLQSLLSSDRVW